PAAQVKLWVVKA
ncbi:hypothetical protein ACJX0J_041738, partial [Zea mays]